MRARVCASAKSTIIALREGSPISRMPQITNAPTSHAKLFASTTATGKSAKQTSGDDERFAPESIRDLGAWNVNKNRCRELDSDGHTVLRNRNAGHVSHIQDREYIGHPRAGSDGYITSSRLGLQGWQSCLREQIPPP